MKRQGFRCTGLTTVFAFLDPSSFQSAGVGGTGPRLVPLAGERRVRGRDGATESIVDALDACTLLRLWTELLEEEVQEAEEGGASLAPIVTGSGSDWLHVKKLHSIR